MTRYVSFISRLTGWNAIKSRVEQLGLEMTDEQIKEVYVRYAGEIGVALDSWLTPLLQYGQDQGHGGYPFHRHRRRRLYHQA